MGIKEYAPFNYAVNAWSKCIKQLRYDAAIVFFGDSLTIQMDFQESFPNYKIVNLGYAGSNLTEMSTRAKVISYVTPEKIFFMGGVNSLDDLTVKKASQIYRGILDQIVEQNPSAEVFIQSILPIATNAESRRLTNGNIKLMNQELQSIAEEYNMQYIDLYSIYELDGVINPEYTYDGVHLLDTAKPLWIEAIREFID